MLQLGVCKFALIEEQESGKQEEMSNYRRETKNIFP